MTGPFQQMPTLRRARAATGMGAPVSAEPQPPRGLLGGGMMGGGMGFAGMAQRGMARPPRPSGLLQQAQGVASAQLAHANPYTTPLVQNTFTRLNQQIGEQADQQRRGIDDEMARRGLRASTVAAGRLGDVAIQQTRAQTDLAQSLLEQQAAAELQSRTSALQNALAVDGQAVGQRQNALSLGLQQALGLGGLQLDQQRFGLQARAQTQAEQAQRDGLMLQLSNLLGLTNTLGV